MPQIMSLEETQECWDCDPGGEPVVVRDALYTILELYKKLEITTNERRSLLNCAQKTLDRLDSLSCELKQGQKELNKKAN